MSIGGKLEKYTDEWFRAEFPEYLTTERRTYQQWVVEFMNRHPGMSLKQLDYLAKMCVRIFGEPVEERIGEDNEFGKVCP